jgi:hypothetical protein
MEARSQRCPTIPYLLGADQAERRILRQPLRIVDWEEVLLPEIERQQEVGKEVVFRADAAFAKPEIYEALEERVVKYAIRLPANDSLLRDVEELLTRPVGRPSHKPIVWYKGFLYQAASWRIARRVVAKVEFHAG